MKKYELAFLISPDISSDDVQRIQEEARTLIIEKGGNILSEKIDPARRELGYEIDKKKSAYLASFVIESDFFKSSELKDALKEKREIVRYIFFTKNKVKKEKRKKEKKEIKILEDVKKEVVEKKTFKKIKFEDIDKEIEKILNK